MLYRRIILSHLIFKIRMLLLLVKLDPGSSNSEDSGDPPSTRPIASYDGLECQYQTASYKTNSFKFMEITVMKFLILRLWLKLGRFETRMLKFRSWNPRHQLHFKSRLCQEGCKFLNCEGLSATDRKPNT